jgi:hypothetical protein
VLEDPLGARAVDESVLELEPARVARPVLDTELRPRSPASRLGDHRLARVDSDHAAIDDRRA